MEFPGIHIGLCNRFKAQVIEGVRVVRETEWANNLILDAGMDRVASMSMCQLFLSCCVGTGNTPTVDDSGVITASRAGTAVTASAPIFAGGDVGKLLRFSTGEKSKITVFTDNQHVTVADSGTVGATVFKMYRVTQTGLAVETKRSTTYLTGASNCFSTRVGGVFTNQRTYDFTAEVGSVNYAEVGFSDQAGAGANLNMRGLFSGGAVTILATQQIRVVYQFIVTLSPIVNRQKTPTITGWPSLVQAVTCDNTTDRITLASHGLLTDYLIQLQGSVAPTGLSFATNYYVKNPTTNDFQLAATPGGAAIDFTTNGTSVTLTTNIQGSEVSESIGLSSIASTGASTGWEGHGSLGGLHNENEPGGTGNLAYIATDTTALRSFPASPPSVSGVPTGGAPSVTLDAYTNGTFTRTKSILITAANGISSAIRSAGLGMSSDFGGLAPGGLRFLFDTKQEKDNLHSLALVWKYVWDRDFS